MRTLILISAVFIGSIFPAFAQVGGQSTFAFLDLPTSARVASMGGNLVSIWDDDLNLTSQNPALLNKSMSNTFNLNYVDYFSDIQFGNVNIAKSFPKYGNFSAGFMYIDYGDFIRADNTGQQVGDFTASEIAFNIMWSMAIDSSFQFGANIKGINSTLETYFANGAALDLGLSYHNFSGLFTASFVLKNIGYQFHTYYSEGSRENLPFEIEAGFSKNYVMHLSDLLLHCSISNSSI